MATETLTIGLGAAEATAAGPAASPILDRSMAKPRIDFLSTMRRVAQTIGKKPMQQLREIAGLQFGATRLSPEEYYYYRLYDDALYTPDQRAAFAGRAIWNTLYHLANDRIWFGVAHDKLIYYGAIGSFGFPVPETFALYARGRSHRGLETLADPEALMRYLRDGLDFPCIGKPVSGMHSVGVVRIVGYERDLDALVLSDGRRAPVERFATEIAAYARDGYLFQRVLDPHPEIAALCGDRLATVRMLVLLDDAGPELLRALVKLPAGANVADNFWREGNMLAALDLEDGTFRHVLRGVGPDQEELAAHPDTGRSFGNFRLPCWSEAKALCLEAATGLPGLRLQAWDVAITPAGPILMEVNVGGDFNLPQLADRAGVLDARLRRFLASRLPTAPKGLVGKKLRSVLTA